MRVVIFCHSLLSDWNHGNAHFLRGIASELCARGHEVRCFEPAQGWSLQNLLRERGSNVIEAFHAAYPLLRSTAYDPERPDVDRMLDGADLVLVHEWSAPELVASVGERRARNPRMRLLFHDTHHRAVSAPHELARFELKHYDGVLAFGEVLRARYLENGWAQRAWVFHEAADTRVFRPLTAEAPAGERDDLVWIGNWGDGERTAELHEFLLEPISALQLRASVYGVRYPDEARRAISHSGARYRGFLSNFEAPAVFAQHKLTIHVPRRFYARELPGIPTIRMFEALACGIPLISAPWQDVEGLFTPAVDYLIARDGRAMTEQLRCVLHDPELARSLREHGRATIERRHTCAHRVDELLHIYRQLTQS